MDPQPRPQLKKKKSVLDFALSFIVYSHPNPLFDVPASPPPPGSTTEAELQRPSTAPPIQRYSTLSRRPVRSNSTSKMDIQRPPTRTAFLESGLDEYVPLPSLGRDLDIGDKGMKEDITCHICLNTLSSPASPCIPLAPKSKEVPVVRVKSCGHVFHRSGLEQWIRLKRTCPVCRRELFRAPRDLRRFASQHESGREKEGKGSKEPTWPHWESSMLGGVSKNEMERMKSVRFAGKGNGGEDGLAKEIAVVTEDELELPMRPETSGNLLRKLSKRTRGHVRASSWGGAKKLPQVMEKEDEVKLLGKDEGKEEEPKYGLQVPLPLRPSTSGSLLRSFSKRLPRPSSGSNKRDKMVQVKAKEYRIKLIDEEKVEPGQVQLRRSKSAGDLLRSVSRKVRRGN